MAGWDDILSGSALGTKGDFSASLSPDDARSIALLGALGDIQKAGVSRTATPFGSIAQNLIPLFGAMIQAKALEKHIAEKQMMAELEKQKLMAEITKLGQGEKPKNIEEAILREREKGNQAGVEELTGIKGKMQKPRSPTGTEVSLGAMQGDPIMVALEARMQAQKLAVAQAQAQNNANIQADLDVKKNAAKKAEFNRTPIDLLPEFKGVTIIDPNTLEVVSDITPAEIDRRGLRRLSKDDADLVRNLKTTMSTLATVDEAGDKVLGNQPTGMLGPVNTLLGAGTKQIESELGMNPDVTTLKTSGQLTAFPVLRMMGAKGNISDKELKLVEDINLRDSKQSKNKKIDFFASKAIDQAKALGINPAGLSNDRFIVTPDGQMFRTGTPEAEKAKAAMNVPKSSATPFTWQVPVGDEEKVLRAIADIKAKNPTANDAEIKYELRLRGFGRNPVE